MPLPPIAISLTTQAAGCAHWVCPDTLKELERAAHADNSASAALSLRTVQANLALLSRRVEAALETCTQDVRNDEDAPVRDFIRLLEDVTRPWPNLRVVR